MKDGFRILLGIKGLDNAKGGAEKVMVALASELAERGHRVNLMTFDRPGGRSHYSLDPRVRRICLGIGRVDRRTTILEFWRRVLAMRRVVKEEQPDIAIGFMHSTYVPMAIAMLGSGVPILASEHIVPEYYRNRRFQYFLLLLSSFLIDRFSVLSDSVGRRFPPFTYSKMITLPNPVYPATLVSHPRGESESPKTVLNVGRFVDFKDQRTLIDAFALVSDSFPDWQLRIFGEGVLRGELEAQVADLGLQERVHLPGATSAIEQEYAAAHIFAISSVYEGFGLVIAEASLHGLPTIGFADCAGTNELIEDGSTGILVDSSNRVPHLAAALRLLMSDPDLRERLGQAGIEKMREYEPGLVFDKWEQTIRSMVSSAR